MSTSIDSLITYTPYDEDNNCILDFSAVGCDKYLYENFRKISFLKVKPSDAPNLNSILHDLRYSKFIFQSGTYIIDDVLTIKRSNISIEGQQNVTLVFNSKEKCPFIFTSDKWFSAKEKPERIISYVPVGSFTIEVTLPNMFKVNDRVIITRNSNKEWITEIGMDRIPPDGNGEPSTQWRPFDLNFDRIIKKIYTQNGKSFIVLNAPIACAIDNKWGGGSIYKYANLRHMNIVIKNFTIKSSTPNAVAIYVNNIENMLVDNVTSINSDVLINMDTGTKNITVRNCSYLEPTSVITGGNRYSYSVNGQLLLVTNCKADKARHAFVVGPRVPGPNVFHRCRSTNDKNSSEPHHRWSVGGLYDNVESTIKVQNRLSMGSGHGWAGANYMIWNCSGTVVCQKPPTANNFCVGHIGKIEKGSFANQPQGTFLSNGKQVEPQSLYEYQLALNK